MKYSITRAILGATLLMVSFSGISQTGNVFLQREYWKSMPDVENAKSKIAEGNDAAERNGNGFDGVTYAILEDAPLSTIEYLISIEGNSPNKITHDGRNYIFWAAYRNDLPVVELLVKKGSRLDIIDTHGNNPLTFAAANGVTNKEMYTFLIESGADVKHIDHHGANALLMIAPYVSDFDMLDFFVSQGLDLKSTDEDGNNAFNYAARTGNIEMMNQLKDKGLEYKKLNNIGGNAMLFAAQGTRNKSNSIEVYKYLEKLGIEPNVTTKKGTTPLHILASRSKDIEVIDYFIKKGVNANQVDGEGNTPLMIAAYRNDLAVVEVLKGETKDINVANKKGETALNNAVAGNTAEVVNYLLGEGAETNDKTGKALIDSYRPGKEKELEAILSSLYSAEFNPSGIQADRNTLLHCAAEKDNLKLVQMAVSWEMDINAKNDDGNTALMIAAMKASNTEVLKYLLDKGADVNLKTEFGERAYDLASENELLAKSNADINFLK